jgi:hypothetical protein
MKRVVLRVATTGVNNLLKNQSRVKARLFIARRLELSDRRQRYMVWPLAFFLLSS